MARATTLLRASYGIDAPYMIPLPILGVVVEAWLWSMSRSLAPIISAAFCFALLGSGLYTTRRGKFVAWARLLDELKLRGDERILDIGCGRGAVLIAAAKRLSTGHAVGVDIWRRQDQWGNGEAATRANAVAEGVSACVTLVTADARSLPFSDGEFDLIVSSIAIHNISGNAERDRAIDEAVRVLKPGGRLCIADIRGTNNYLRRINERGIPGATRRSMGWHMWWGGPWAATRVVSCEKPIQ